MLQKISFGNGFVKASTIIADATQQGAKKVAANVQEYFPETALVQITNKKAPTAKITEPAVDFFKRDAVTTSSKQPEQVLNNISESWIG